MRILTSWLAAFAILVAGLAPALAHGVSPKASATLIEVCGAQGSKWVRLDGTPAKPPPASDGQHAGKQCAACCLQAHAVALTTASPGLPAARFAHERPDSTFPPLHLRRAWITAQPRAPPVLS